MWNNPLLLQPGMKKQDLDELRKGWDLLLDIDCKHWHYSSYAADLLIKALQDFGIKSIDFDDYPTIPIVQYFIHGSWRHNLSKYL